MAIDPDFPKNWQVHGKHDHTDGQHYHFVWGPGRPADASANRDVKTAYAARNEELVPLGVHGTFVAVDWDSCIAEGSCLPACPVNDMSTNSKYYLRRMQQTNCNGFTGVKEKMGLCNPSLGR
jgi:NAD-dependent dihydropyrimidine dehydrogenase PreA subunit